MHVPSQTTYHAVLLFYVTVTCQVCTNVVLQNTMSHFCMYRLDFRNASLFSGPKQELSLMQPEL